MIPSSPLFFFHSHISWPFASAREHLPLVFTDNKERRTNVYFVVKWEMCFHYITRDRLRPPMVPTKHDSTFFFFFFFQPRFQHSFALCQGNRHFMSRHWGIKLIKRKCMVDYLQLWILPEQESKNNNRYSSHSPLCRNEINLLVCSHRRVCSDFKWNLLGINLLLFQICGMFKLDFATH